MMKRLTLLLLTFILLTACSNESLPMNEREQTADQSITNSLLTQNEKDVLYDLDYFSGGRYTATIIEDNGTVYFAKQDGIYRDEKEGQSVLICSADQPDHLLFRQGKLYFTCEQNNALYCVNATGGTPSCVFDAQAQIGFAGELGDYQIVDDVLYITNASLAYAYDLSTGKATQLTKDGMSVSQVEDGEIFYMDHASRTFTIYGRNLQTEQEQILVGKGDSEPDTDIIQDFIRIEDALYYYKRMPAGLYRYQDGVHEIIDDGDLNGLRSYNGNLYYVQSDLTDGYLYQYDGTNSQKRLVAVLDEFDASSGYTIVDGHVYYQSGVSIQKNADGHVQMSRENCAPKSVMLGQ